ncbi:hypothetical protein Tco_0763816 [Tanacetum coccineum]
MTHKLDDMIELPKSQLKKTYEDDLECEMVMVKMPRKYKPTRYPTNPTITTCDLPGRSRRDFRNTDRGRILDETQLHDLGLNTCNHDIPLSSREVPSFDEPQPLPNPLPNCPSLDVNLGKEKGPEPPIKPHSPDSFRMKEVDSLTIHTPPSPHVASFHPKDVY